MAAGIINLQKASGGITKISSADGTGVTELVVPESGNLVSINTAVTDNAIARYDGTTGKLQNSGVIIDDNGNVGIGTSTPIHKISSYKATGWNTGVGTQSGSKFIQLSADSNFGTDIFWDSTSLLRFSTGSASDATGYTERMRINASGNVGIGTTIDNGVDKLQVNGSISSGQIPQISNGDLNNYQTRTQVLGTYPSSYVSNIPINDHGYLEVIVYSPGAYVMQRFTTLGVVGAPGRIFVRCLVHGVWSTWVEK